MTKRTLITTFALATLLLGSLIGVGLTSHQRWRPTPRQFKQPQAFRLTPT